MTIVFLCGSLEPGRDGVGDYTLRLAGELIKQGNSAAAVALFDWYVADVHDTKQDAEGVGLPVLRIPQAWPSRARMERVEKWVEAFDPQWLSIQFVPFAFHVKGLPYGLGSLLKKLGKGRRWHIMFHELWVGMNSEASGMNMLWGSLQRIIIQRLIACLKPQHIHTQCHLYLLQLEKLGAKTSYLPLFTNIPSTATNPYLKKDWGEAKGQFSMVLFGSIHPGAPVEQFSKEVASLARECGAQIKLIIVGWSGKEQRRWANVWETAGLPVCILGESTPDLVSKVMHQAGFGIATTPVALAEKSGSVAAMLSHGLPVLCVSKPWTPRNRLPVTVPQGVVEYKMGNLKACINRKYELDYSNTVTNVSRQFVNSILNH